jgi:hypothetical protein
MALMTMIARVIDGLPLVGTMQEDEQVFILIHSKRNANFQIFTSIFMFISKFSLEKVFWNTKIKRKCCLEN